MLGYMQVSMFGQLGAAGTESPIDATIANLAMLRGEGFKRVWMSQLPYEPDLLTVLAIALHEVDTIEVASGVVPIQNLHPMLMAQRALTVSLASGGRFILGLGMTHQAVTEGMWGIPWDKPVRRLNEYLDGLLPLLRGEPADAAGETVTTRGALMISGAPRPDVYIAALGPQLLRIAGRRTSGTCTWMTGPKTLGQHVGPALRQAAADAGRASAVRVAASLPICVTDDVDTARKQAAEQFAMYGQLPSYRAMLDREGYAGPQDAAIIGDEETVRGRLDELAPDWREREAWACGPRPLVEALEALWADPSQPTARPLHVERFTPTTPGNMDRVEGTLTFARSGSSVASDGSRTVLDLAEESDLAPFVGCRMGVCRRCVVPLRSGTVVDMRDGRTECEPGAHVQICVAAPVGDVEIEI